MVIMMEHVYKLSRAITEQNVSPGPGLDKNQLKNQEKASSIEKHT